MAPNLPANLPLTFHTYHLSVTHQSSACSGQNVFQNMCLNTAMQPCVLYNSSPQRPTTKKNISGKKTLLHTWAPTARSTPFHQRSALTACTSLSRVSLETLNPAVERSPGGIDTGHTLWRPPRAQKHRLHNTVPHHAITKNIQAGDFTQPSPSRLDAPN